MKKIKNYTEEFNKINNEEPMTTYECIKMLLNNDIRNLELLDDVMDFLLKRIYILYIINITIIIFAVLILLFK